MLNMHFVTSVALPVCVLAALAFILPLVVTPASTRSQRRLMISVSLSSLALLVIGTVLMAVLYQAEGVDLVGAIAHSPVDTIVFFVKRSGLAALIWGPLLALAWFNMAQKIEHLKGKDGIAIGLGRRAGSRRSGPVTPPVDAAETPSLPPE